MYGFLKKIVKNTLSKTSWRLKKIYKNKEYVSEKPNLDLLNSLYNSRGIIHMGAHRGKEAAIYDWLQKKTIWIEANPYIIPDLKDHICQFPYQKVILALLTDKDDTEIEFKISNNDSASSSIFEFGKKSIEQDLKMVSRIKLKSQKLDTIFNRESIEISEYDFWIMDLQGAELLALKGATNSLEKCRAILVEISKSDYYLKATKWDELKSFLNSNKFYQKWEPKESHTDVLFVKNN